MNTNPGLDRLSASDLCTRVKMPSYFEEKPSSLNSSTSSSKKSLKNRKDLTAVGQATNLAAVALFLNTNRAMTSNNSDVEAAACYHSEPERISNYRNSVAFMDAEVEVLLSRRKSSKFLPR